MNSQKLVNLKRAQESLERALADPVIEDRDLGGIIKAFECAYELTWTALKRNLAEQGHNSQGAKDVFKTAWQLGLLPGDDTVWFEMIRQSYCPLLRELIKRISGRGVGE